MMLLVGKPAALAKCTPHCCAACQHPAHRQAHGRMGKVTDAMATFEALLKDRSAAADLRARKHYSVQYVARVQVWQPAQRGSLAPQSALCCT